MIRDAETRVCQGFLEPLGGGAFNSNPEARRTHADLCAGEQLAQSINARNHPVGHNSTVLRKVDR